MSRMVGLKVIVGGTRMSSSTGRGSALGVLLLSAWAPLAAIAQQNVPEATNAPPPVPPAAALEIPPAAGPELERVTFKDAIDRTLARNPSVQEAVAEVLRAAALVEQARSNSLPSAAASAMYVRLPHAVEFEGLVVTPQGTTTANATATVPLLNLVNWASWAHSFDNRKIAELSLAQVKRNEAVAAANAFLTVIARKRVLEANQRALANARAHYDQSHQRQLGGVASRLEEVQAAQEGSADEVLVAQSALDVRRAQEALGVLLAAEGPVDTSDEPTFEQVGDLDAALAGFEARRADLQVLAMRETAAAHVLRDSWRDYFPLVNFLLIDLFQSPSSVFAPAHLWQAELQASVPIFDGGFRLGQNHERQALVKEAHENLVGGEIQARSEVRAGIDAIRLADQQLASAQHAADQAHEALSISNLSYSAGASTSLDVLDAERRARDADTQVATAEDAARQARLDLLVASGKFP
jgi:outer membrane protein TolC